MPSRPKSKKKKTTTSSKKKQIKKGKVQKKPQKGKKSRSAYIKEKTQAIKNIYQKYSQKLDELAEKQTKIIADFLESLKEKRLKELREKIK